MKHLLKVAVTHVTGDRIKVFLVFFIAGLFSVGHTEDKAWQEKMREVSNAFGEVIPYLYPTADKDIKGLTEKVTKLYRVTEQLDVKRDHIIKNGDFDPALLYLGNGFQEQIDRAYKSLKEGYADYARYVLRDSVSYCISCHTRTSSGAQFPLLKAFDEPLRAAPWITRVDFLAASRQYDPAFDQVIEELKKPSGQAVSSIDLERGSRLALAVAIRVKQDPAMALRLARAVKDSKNANYPMKQAAKDWERDIRDWQREPPKNYSSAEDMLIEAKRLVGRAEKSRSQGHDEVNYLRATRILHELLRKYPESREMPEAFYLIGVSYRPLQELGLWNLQEKYFHACILKVPHSELAEKCYKDLEESITLGFSGSSGTHVPPDIQSYLEKLKDQAKKIQEAK